MGLTPSDDELERLHFSSSMIVTISRLIRAVAENEGEIKSAHAICILAEHIEKTGNMMCKEIDLYLNPTRSMTTLLRINHALIEFEKRIKEAN